MASFSVRASLCALFAALALAGCGDDGGNGTSGQGGAAGLAGAGAMGGVGGTAGGGTGGTAGGGTGGAAGMGGDTIPGCEAAVAGDAAALHEAALTAFTGGCSFSSCHDADGERAGLILLPGDNLNTVMVDKPACQVPALSLVKSGGGDAALTASWVWQKLVAPDDDDMFITPQAAWGTPVVCQQTRDFGTRMPMTGLDLSEARIGAIRNWICAGAAGP
jgi:hypothetical protein